jgi:hypothetical protein
MKWFGSAGKGYGGFDNDEPIHDRIQLVQPDFEKIEFVEECEAVEDARHISPRWKIVESR